jgi:hypothetical protein
LNNGPECTVAPVVARGFNTTTSGYVGPWSIVYITSQTKTVVTMRGPRLVSHFQ